MFILICRTLIIVDASFSGLLGLKVVKPCFLVLTKMKSSLLICQSVIARCLFVLIAFMHDCFAVAVWLWSVSGLPLWLLLNLRLVLCGLDMLILRTHSQHGRRFVIFVFNLFGFNLYDIFIFGIRHRDGIGTIFFTWTNTVFSASL